VHLQEARGAAEQISRSDVMRVMGASEKMVSTNNPKLDMNSLEADNRVMFNMFAYYLTEFTKVQEGAPEILREHNKSIEQAIIKQFNDMYAKYGKTIEEGRMLDAKGLEGFANALVKLHESLKIWVAEVFPKEE